MTRAQTKAGLWLIGAAGNVASTVALGLAALQRRRIATTGLVTELPALHPAGLPPMDTFALGGHEIRSATILQTLRDLRDEANMFRDDLLRACAPSLRAFQRNIRPGTTFGTNTPKGNERIPPDETAEQAVARLTEDLLRFRKRHRLEHVVVINLSSSEPRPKVRSIPRDAASLRKAMRRRSGSPVPPSALYALAAVEAGCAYVNFTPSVGIDLPVLRRHAEARGVPYAGNDGKTGETLVKSALAPMFTLRNLRVLSWAGQNLLGNRDGRTLREARTRAAKVRSKEQVIRHLLPPGAEARTGIEYVASLGDWKIAWDHVHFEGFLGTKMRLQFCWEGCDSALAAPLVIDLARLAILALRREERGPLKHLAFFFKDPIGTTPHDLVSQWQALVAHVAQTTARRSRRSRR